MPIPTVMDSFTTQFLHLRFKKVPEKGTERMYEPEGEEFCSETASINDREVSPMTPQQYDFLNKT